MSESDVELPAQFTHSVKLSDTQKGIRIDVHVYANSKESAINQAIETYLETKLKAEGEKIPIASIEVLK